MINYRWALLQNKRSDALLLPLSTALDEPEGLAEIVKEFDLAEQTPQEKNTESEEKKLDKKPLYIEVALNNQPADFFFKLATYLDAHLSEPWYLWRTGAILDFYGNDKTRAIIEMPQNVLSIRVMGENKENFQQLLLICVRETIDSYKSDTISAHSYERIWIDGTHSQMLSSEIIANLTSGTTIVDKLVKQKLKGAVNMTTINITGNVTKSNIAGEHNIMTNEGDVHLYMAQLNEEGNALVEELREIVASLPVDDNQNDLSGIKNSIKQIEDGVAEENIEKKKGLIRKGLDGIKDLVVIDKGLDLLVKYPVLTALFTGASAM